MTNLNRVLLASGLHVRVEFLEVSLNTAAVEFHGVETEGMQCVNVAGVELGVSSFVLGADAVVACIMRPSAQPRFWGAFFSMRYSPYQPAVSLRLWAWSVMSFMLGKRSVLTMGLPSLSWKLVPADLAPAAPHFCQLSSRP